MPGAGAAWTVKAPVSIEKGVRVVGIDAWSWDRPLPYLAQEFKETGNPKVIWEAHFAGIDMGYCHMEKMANFSAIGRSQRVQRLLFSRKDKTGLGGMVPPRRHY